MHGLLAYGTYVPYWRLDRQRIAEALLTPAGRGTRAVASYDEDTTTMGVEAARVTLAAAPEGLRPHALYLATSAPAYADKTNATAIHAALGLDRAGFAADMAGAVRSAFAAVGAGLDASHSTLVVLSDMRTGLPGGADEAGGGDAAAALLFGEGPVLAEVIGGADASAEFLERWRMPGDDHSRVWEERFGETAYVPLAEEVWAEALKSAGITADAVDHLAICGVHARAARRFGAGSGVRAEALHDDLTGVIGNTGAAHLGILLADVLDQAVPGDTVALLQIADGAVCLLLRVTDAIVGYRERRDAGRTLAAQIAGGRADLGYPAFLTWKGQLHREPPRRPDPTSPAAPPSLRHEEWKFGFTGSRCVNCGTRHLPPARVCISCGAVDQMVPERLADVPGRIATFTVDRLAFSLSPPVVAVVVDFDGGGRIRCEMTDVDPATVAIGDRVQMTFRKISTANGIHNYFWKARPAQGES